VQNQKALAFYKKCKFSETHTLSYRSFKFNEP
jgi:hypothetical protein